MIVREHRTDDEYILTVYVDVGYVRGTIRRSPWSNKFSRPTFHIAPPIHADIMGVNDMRQFHSAIQKCKDGIAAEWRRIPRGKKSAKFSIPHREKNLRPAS